MASVVILMALKRNQVFLIKSYYAVLRAFRFCEKPQYFSIILDKR